MLKKKSFLASIFFLMFAVSLWTAPAAKAAKSPQTPLAGAAIPQFMQPLPLLTVQTGGTISTVFGNQALTINMCEFDANILPLGTFAAGVQPTTRVFGYIVGTSCPTTGAKDTYIGPVIVNKRDHLPGGVASLPTSITWVNNLGTVDNTQVLAWKFSTDQTLHWADPIGGEQNICAQQPTFPGYGTFCAQNYGYDVTNNVWTNAPIPAVVHLHGGEVPPELDGGPDAWFTSNGNIKGHGYYTAGTAGNSALYKYPNTQEAADIWFHDHVLGITRLNVYAGLAGAYIIWDPATTTNADFTGGTCDPTVTPPICLPSDLGNVANIIPVVIQDRMFDTTGQLFFPADSAGNVLWSTNPEHPYWVPEFVGDTIVVNGKAWPFLEVKPNKYRFLFLNGSNARTYELFLPNLITGTNVPLWVISNDGGYLANPVAVNKLVIMPGERYGVIIDFTGIPAGTNLILKNTGRTPFPKGAPPQGATLGQIIQFRVTNAPTPNLPVAPPITFTPTAATNLRPGNPIVRLTTAGALPTTVNKTRQLTLNEDLAPAPPPVIDPVTGVLTAYPGGPLEILVNNTKWGGKLPDGSIRNDFTPITTGNGTTGQVTTYYSELPNEGDTEVWEIVNLTADAHPIHLHLVQFQIINRQNFNVGKYTKTYNAAFTGGPAPLPTQPTQCVAGAYCPGYGPPLDYNTGNARALGGNPDIVPWLQGTANPPLPEEAGWKDTVVAYPGQVTRLAVRWAPTDILTTAAATALYYPFNPDGIDSNQPGHGYVWHCHIIDHEDNEMMRPDVVIYNSAAPPAGRPLVKETAY